MFCSFLHFFREKKAFFDSSSSWLHYIAKNDDDDYHYIIYNYILSIINISTHTHTHGMMLSIKLMSRASYDQEKKSDWLEFDCGVGMDWQHRKTNETKTKKKKCIRSLIWLKLNWIEYIHPPSLEITFKSYICWWWTIQIYLFSSFNSSLTGGCCDHKKDFCTRMIGQHNKNNFPISLGTHFCCLSFVFLCSNFYPFVLQWNNDDDDDWNKMDIISMKLKKKIFTDFRFHFIFLLK